MLNCGGNQPSVVFSNTVRIGHPSGVMTMIPTVIKHGDDMTKTEVPGVAVQRTARRIMEGTLFVRN